MATVLAFPCARPTAAPARSAAYPIVPCGGDVYVCLAHDDRQFLVYDESPSGGSAGMHGCFDTHAEAVAEGRRIAAQIGGTFHDLTERGSSAACDNSREQGGSEG